MRGQNGSNKDSLSAFIVRAVQISIRLLRRCGGGKARADMIYTSSGALDGCPLLRASCLHTRVIRGCQGRCLCWKLWCYLEKRAQRRWSQTHVCH